MSHFYCVHTYHFTDLFVLDVLSLFVESRGSRRRISQSVLVHYPMWPTWVHSSFDLETLGLFSGFSGCAPVRSADKLEVNEPANKDSPQRTTLAAVTRPDVWTSMPALRWHRNHERSTVILPSCLPYFQVFIFALILTIGPIDFLQTPIPSALPLKFPLPVSFLVTQGVDCAPDQQLSLGWRWAGPGAQTTPTLDVRRVAPVRFLQWKMCTSCETDVLDTRKSKLA